MQVSRIIGEYKGSEKGPLLVFIGGLHGNELAGIHAIRDVFNQLEKHKPEIKGRIVGLAGNVKAIGLETRYVDRDMNRVWLTDLKDQSINELSERDELIQTISRIYSSEDDGIAFFDLHSTSSPSEPFIMISDSLRNRDLSNMVNVPIVLGLLEQLHGMFLDVTSISGIPTMIFQGGREGDEETIAYHKGLIWTSLREKCGTDLSVFPGAEELAAKLASKLPKNPDHLFFEITYMFKIPKGATFSMNPGYRNFQPIKRGEELAVCNGIKVKAPSNGCIFMPLYQSQGREGFYIVRPIAPFWIRLSRRLRGFRHHDKLNWLVGVKKVAKSPLTYRLDTQVTFIWALSVFHLLGYTNIRKDGPFLFMSQIEDEINPPLPSKAIDYFSNRNYLRNEIKEIESEWTIPFSGQR